ncbi:MAG: hypothetical protein PSX71_14090 [bacterium]|nr:hypothetical protein [bacterium]
MKWLNALGSWWESITPGKRHLLGTLMIIAMTAAGVPAQVANIAGALIGSTASVPVAVVPPVPLQIGTVPDILWGLVPPVPAETSSRDTQGPPEGVK